MISDSRCGDLVKNQSMQPRQFCGLTQGERFSARERQQCPQGGLPGVIINEHATKWSQCRARGHSYISHQRNQRGVSAARQQFDGLIGRRGDLGQRGFDEDKVTDLFVADGERGHTN